MKTLHTLSLALVVLSSNPVFGSYKPIPKTCRGKLITQEIGCHDCGLIAYINLVPWLLHHVHPDELRLAHQRIMLEHPELKVRGPDTLKLVEIIKHEAYPLGVYPSRTTLSALKNENQGILLLTNKLGDYGHYVSLINTEFISEAIYLITILDPADPSQSIQLRLYLQPDGSGRIAQPELSGFNFVDSNFISIDYND
ncbi:MAG: hypothetical protein R3A80_13735 [Bdellovibrionota bacterium]